MDFFDIKQASKKGKIEIYPDFKVEPSKDLMIKGKTFYAIWDEKAGLWSTNEYDVARLVDSELNEEAEKLKTVTSDTVIVKSMKSYSSKSWIEFKNYISKVSDSSKQLDKKITFRNTEVKKSDYISRKLDYDMEEGPCDAFDEIMGTLYDEEERKKIEWAIGSIIFGDAKTIQKFIVLYGEAGSGKSTVLNIIQKLFNGYYITFDAKALTSSNNSFSTAPFKSNPLVAIQHDGDLSKIEDNTILNSIVAHEEILINEKYQSSYPTRLNCFLFMATNKPVKITDAKSGIIRRLIDVRPSGNKIAPKKYQALMSQIDFELGAIAHKCLELYLSMGKNYYSTYRPVDMMYKTDPFFNFVENSYFIFKDEDGTTLKKAYSLYKEYCNESGMNCMQMYKFREELKNYFERFDDQFVKDGEHIRSYYSGFLSKKFNRRSEPVEEAPYSLVLDKDESIFDKKCAKCPAQYANDKETPIKRWVDVTTTLKDVDTSKLHYVRVPENHIVIDFDLKDEKGNKSYELNLAEASKWPPTYAELSKGGQGIHLHYIYKGDPSKLSRVYADNIEIKVFTGNSSLRRRLSKCNDIPISIISSGLPLKMKGDKVVNFDVVKSEKGLRALIKKNLRKEIHPGTKPSVDFIFKILDDAYNSDLTYDVSDMRQAVLTFAANSTHQAEYCVKMVGKMKFKSEDQSEGKWEYVDDSIIFYDVEVFPNLLLVNYKKEGPRHKVIRMINPSPADIEKLIQHKLVGFNCRRYDNHILYARMMGYDNEQIYKLSQRIVNGNKSAFFGEAYNLSYTDIYDFSSKKQSLKKFEIELGIHHQELGLPWDQPVPEKDWVKVAEYCDNDVIATEAVWNSRQQDFVARQILAELSGLSVNDTTRTHTTKIIFGGDKHPDLRYTDLSSLFSGYVFENGHSSYKGEDPGEGGYVYAEPGMYGNVAVLDIASMHPSSIISLDLFGSYTSKFKDILDARLFIKHKEFNKAKKLMNGALAPFLVDENQAKELSQALKIVINSVYGYTTATFENPFKDPRNVDNIVAKRGSLFMIDLKKEVQAKGFTVAHIKTDSIKIPDATPEIISFVQEYGKKWGYNFEHEATYDRMCLVNDAVLIAKYKDTGKWSAIGAQFQQPYVFKTLFSKEPIEFDDMCETKTVSTALYLDMNDPEIKMTDINKMDRSNINGVNLHVDMNEGKDTEYHDYHFVGKAGRFCPMKPGTGGGDLLREKDGKYYSATGSKGYKWMESEIVKNLHKEKDIDTSYYIKLVDEAIDTINKFGDFEWFVSEDPYIAPPFVGGKVVGNI